MSDFSLDVDSSDLVNASQALGEFANDWAKMVSRIKSEQRSLDAAVKASATVQEAALDRIVGASHQKDMNAWFASQRRRLQMMKESERIAQSQAKEEARLTAELQKQQQVREDIGRAFTAGLNNRLGVTGTQVVDSGAGYEALEREITSLTAKYNPLGAAATKYARIQAEITRAQRMGIITTQQQESALEQLKREYDALSSGVVLAGSRFNQFGNVADFGGKNLNRMNMYAQQAGYQFADFAVQVQGGTSALVALGQQGSQLLGIFGAGGAIAGAVLAIGTAVALPLVRMNQGAKDFDDALKSAVETAKSLKDELRLSASGLENATQLTFKDSLEDAQREYDIAKKTRDEFEARQKVMGASLEIQLQTREASEVILEPLEEALRIAQERQDSYERDLELQAESNSLQEGWNAIYEVSLQLAGQKAEQQAADKVSAEERLNALTQEIILQSTIAKYGEDSTQVTILRAAAERDAFQALVDSWDVSKELKDELLASWQNATSLANTNMESAIMAAAGAAGILAGQLGVSLATARAIQALGPQGFNNNPDPSGKVYSGRGGDPRGFGDTSLDRSVVEADNFLANYKPPKSGGGRKGGGSGGGAGSSAPDAVQTLKDEMRLRRELLSVFGAERTLREEVQRIEQSLGDARSNYTNAFIEDLARQNIALKDQEALYEELVASQQEMSDIISGSMSEAFMSIIDGTSSVEDAFKKMARNIILQLTEVLFVQRLVGSFDAGSGKGSGLAGFIGKALFSFDGGGYTGSGPRSGGMDGKGGFMAMLHPNETVIDHTKGSSSGVTTNQGKQQIELILRAADGVTVETVRNEAGAIINQAAPKIVGASVKASQKNMRASKNPWGL
jgi:hypothetical protein